MINVGGNRDLFQSMPPVQREWQNPGMVNSHGPGSGAPPTAPGLRMVSSDRNFLPLGGRVDSSGPGRGNLPPMGPMGGGGFQSMMRPPMGGGFGGGNNMVQGPSFMQQPSGGYAQPRRTGGAGGMVDPNFRRMMDFKSAGGMGSAIAQRPGSNAQYGPGAFGVSPSLYYQHFDQQGMPLPKQQPQQNMGMGGDPMQMMMQMMPFWQMYSQMLSQNQGGQRSY